MKRTGEVLRKAREAKGLSINELALSLKINSKALTAIEEGDLSRLPAKTFLRGFVQSYAQALKIDSDEVLDLFAEEMGTTRPQPLIPPGTNAPESMITLATPAAAAPASDAPAAAPSPAPPRAKGQNRGADGSLAGLEEGNRMRVFAISAVALVLVFLIFGTKKIIDRYQRESETGNVVVANPIVTETPAAVPADGVTAPATPVAPAEAAGAMSTPMTPVTPPAPAPVEAKKPVEPVKPAEVKKPEPPKAAEAPKPAEKKPEEKKTEEKKAEDKKPEETTKPAEAPKPPAAKPVELIIEAMDAVDVEYTAASGSPEKIKLSEGQVHTIRSRGGLKLSVSNGGVVNLILNGRDLGVPGVIGKPVQLNY